MILVLLHTCSLVRLITCFGLSNRRLGFDISSFDDTPAALLFLGSEVIALLSSCTSLGNAVLMDRLSFGQNFVEEFDFLEYV